MDYDDSGHNTSINSSVSKRKHKRDHTTFKFFQWGRELESIQTNHHFTEKEKLKLKSCSSVDYFPQNSEVYKKYLHTHHQKSNKNTVKWVLMGCIGFIVGLIGFFLKSLIELITRFKFEIVSEYLLDSLIHGLLVYLLITILLIIVSSFIVVYVSPISGGSGVPEVMGYLNGVYIKNIYSLPNLVIKFLSCILAVASGLPVGPEGPMISIGALIGHSMSKISALKCFRNNEVLSLFNNMKDCRDFVSAGAAAGVSSAFGSPVGGLLFAMEEVSSFWNQRLSWQVFFASMMSTFTTDLFMSAFGGFEMKQTFGIFSQEASIVFDIQQTIPTNIILFIPSIIIGIIGGILGSLFTFLNLKINRFRAHKIKKYRFTQIIEVLIYVILYGIITIYVPSIYNCQQKNDNISEIELTQYNCKDGWYNEAASLLFVSGENGISRLFSRSTHLLFGFGSLIFIFFLYFPMSIFVAGASISSGLVVPMLFIGALYGRFIGLIMVKIFGVFPSTSYWSFIDPGGLALLGAASFFLQEYQD